MSRKTEEDVVFVPVDELEKELGSVVQKLMNELRKSHSRNRDLEKELQSTEERNAITEERLHAMTDKKKREEKCFKEEFMALMDSHKRLESQLHKKISSEISLNRDLKKKETELQGKEEVIQKKNSDMEALNKHISDSKIYIEKLQSRIDDITENKAKDDLLHKETVESLLSRIENMEAQKTQDDLLHKETVEGLQSRIQEMSAEKTDTVKKLQAHVDEERKNRFELSYQYSQLIQTTQAPENVKKPYDPEHQIQSLLLLRQDKEQQTEISHYIAELSDEKKPTKLTEEFSELYDNEWIDAFEDTFKGNEKQTADFMLKLLMRANEICRNACSEHTSAIKRSFCTLVIETDPPMGEVCGEVPGRIASGSKGKRQASDDRHGRTNIAKQKKNIETDFEQTLRNEENKTVIEIGKFFKQRLSEGVEKVGTEIIMEEQSINQCSKSVVAYIQKCMNICWSMCRHVPPVHVDFPDISGDIPFDTNKYKPYTKSGKYVQYIVWPAVYLHEGGPLLCKGIAQGRN
ncbi:desmoplakin-like isoform X2 [Mercenaria mercenaria]|uniref:desmoplakin-like isoform X2 n=1 Tax=Mercenaria mercenaria TaxID=6596 RepID=UPI00234F587B|nr:desmoplakin-like isoform X2 [Mercenaria mercenaria]